MGHENNSAMLAQALEQQNKQLLCMLDALYEEYRALSSQDVGVFERAVLNKQEQVKALEEIQSHLVALEPMLNGRFSKNNIESYIRKMPASQERLQLERLWSKLQETTTNCSKQNIINNRIIDASSTQLRRALSILRGNLTGPTVDIYGASGKQNNNSQRQSLATA